MEAVNSACYTIFLIYIKLVSIKNSLIYGTSKHYIYKSIWLFKFHIIGTDYNHHNYTVTTPATIEKWQKTRQQDLNINYKIYFHTVSY